MDASADLSAENARLRDELAQTRAALDDFTQSVAHDLRAPLRHIKAYAQIIREELNPQSFAEVTQHLETVSQAAQLMERQIDGLMALAQIMRVELVPIELQPGPVLAQLCASLAATHPEQHIVVELAQDFPLLLCDPVLLRQALSQVLDNAVKFSAKAVQTHIRVSWCAAGDSLCELSVCDQGAGFAPQQAGRLFQAFVRLHAARDYAGLGLGLTMVRCIAQRHGGAVAAEAEVNGGCTVRIRLPLASA